MQETAQQYTARILGYVEGKEPLKIQQATPKKLAALIKRVSRKKLTRRPEPGRWSVGEILAHLADAELVGSWRIRMVLCQTGTTLQAYDQNMWASTFNYPGQDPQTSLDTFTTLRESNLRLLKSVPQKLWENYGMHQERGKETIARLIRMYAGHDLNHLRQVEAIIRGK